MNNKIKEDDLKELPNYIRWIEILIKWIIGIVIIIIWSLIGFFFWIPILLRACLIYSVVLFASVVGTADINRAMRSLSLAIRFYPRGFVLIKSSIFGYSLDDEIPESSRPFTLTSFFHIIFESIFATFVWVVSLNFLNLINVDILKYLEQFSLFIRESLLAFTQSN